ncbi:hypothetical protein SAMN05661044_04042 [Olivibacter domesticus]|uniref:Uncharacterized protein n=1 Tax=Olivibacter domesticus TaxID=407022 RepID=A0A1H7V0Z5_OLID1|nr:hypothetical protein SAMN05661044_04042 [Olivibacter domesticus]
MLVLALLLLAIDVVFLIKNGVTLGGLIGVLSTLLFLTLFFYCKRYYNRQQTYTKHSPKSKE